MITLITGENQFRIDEALHRLSGEMERHEGQTLTRETLMSALHSVSLFGTDTVVVIDSLSQQKSLWEALPEIVGDVTSVELVLLEPKPDKRLKVYKWLAKEATIVDCSHFLASDTRAAEKWLMDYATGLGVSVQPTQVSDMVRRAVRSDAGNSKPIIDQQLLATAVRQLQSAEAVTAELIDTVLAPSAYENVFQLLGTALDGRADAVARQVATMRHGEEAYMVLGLLASQMTQLAALVLAGGEQSIDEVAKATGAHPFALRSMQAYSKRLSLGQLAYYVELLKTADEHIKTSSTDPWTAIDIALTKMALRSRG